MKAFQLVGGSEDLVGTTSLNDVAQPDPGPGQVLVRVGGAGACHSDVTLMEFSTAAPREVPMTLGHENAGWIEAFGPGTIASPGLEIGAPVAVYGAWGCGACQNCRKGMENYCANAVGSGPGLSVDGGMAEYLLVPSTRYLVPLGDMAPVEAAPLTDAGLTPYHAIKMGLHLLVPGSYAVVIGAGGLGHLAVQFLKALSPATVICVDQRESALEVVAGLGADHTVVAGPDAAAEIRGIMGGRGAEMVLDICGYDDTLALAAAVVGSLGPAHHRRRRWRHAPGELLHLPLRVLGAEHLLGLDHRAGRAAGHGPHRRVPGARQHLLARPGRRRLPLDGRRHPAGPGRHRPQPVLRPGPPETSRREPTRVPAAGATGARVGCAFGMR